MNFCVAILILKIEENTPTFLAYYAYYFKKGKIATEMQEATYAVYGEGAMTDRMCQKWFVKFRAGDFSLHGAPWWGRPVDQIETLIENNQHCATQVTTDILKISKSIQLLVKRQN